MAASANVGSFCVVSVFVFTCALFSLVLTLQYDEEFNLQPNPSNSDVHLLRADSSFFESDDPSITIYRLDKRSAASPPPPLKKAIQNEKKTILKSLPTVSSEIFSKKQAIEDQNVLENSTVPSNTTVLDVSTPGTKSLDAKYNTTADNQSSATYSTSSNSSTTSSNSSTTSPTTTTTTVFPEVLPSMPSNITNTTVDNHVYYNSLFLEEDEAMSYWVNFDDLPKGKVNTHDMLSDSYRRAATVTLSFDFPFYGHPLRNITIATGGFLYMGGYMHSWLAATQYVAPLMANFDTSISNESIVQYFDNGTAFVIQWNVVALQDEKQGGNFTFQATLMRNGNIIFVYNTIPISVTEISDKSHPVKVGLSDAYVIDRIIYFIRRKTIYEYHRIDMKKGKIGNHTAIYFTALPTCLSYHDCKSCMDSEIGLDCVWCDSAKRCSDGLDRQRQKWLQQRWDVEKSLVNCSSLPSRNTNPVVQPFTDLPPKTYTIYTPTSTTHDNSDIPAAPPQLHVDADDDEISHSAQVSEQQGAVGVGVVAILLILAVVLGLSAWIGYAYRNPHMSSGQLLIRYRPTQWRFRSGEARYTAASVHM